MKEYPMWKPPTKALRRKLRLAKRSLRSLPDDLNPSSPGRWMHHAREWQRISGLYPEMPASWHADLEGCRRECLSTARWALCGRIGRKPSQFYTWKAEVGL